MALYAIGDKVPTIHEHAFVHPDAVIIGDDEAAAGQVTVKPLRGSGEQQRCALAQATQLMRE